MAIQYKFDPFSGAIVPIEPGPQGPQGVQGPTGTVSAAGDGTAALPGIAFAADTNTGIYRPGADQLALSTNGTGRLFINAAGEIGIAGNAASGYGLTVSGGLGNFQVSNNGAEVFFSRDSNNNIFANGGTSSQLTVGGRSAFSIQTGSTLTERARIDSSGRLLVGTSSARSNFAGNTATPLVQIEGVTAATASSSVVRGAADATGPTFNLGKTRGASVGLNTAVVSGDQCGVIAFQGADGTNLLRAAQIEAAVDTGTVSGTSMPGRLVFSTTADGAASPTERMRITSTGQVRLAGAGITFNGDTATANELDDYEEGTWTPVYTPTTGSFTTMTMNVQSARYVKIGQLVTVQAYIVTSNVDVTGASGSVNITGLPFTSYSAQSLRRSGAIGFSTSFATAPQFWGIVENSTTINLYEARLDALDVADLSTGAGSFNIIWLEASYYAA